MAVSGSGFAQDLVTRIINVNWGGKLPVEFVAPGRLDLLPPLNMGEATISLWFRFPQSSATAAQADFFERIEHIGFGVDMVLAGVIPLITWGTTTVLEEWQRDPTQEVVATSLEGPSYIGIGMAQYYGAEPDPEFKPALVLRFQSDNYSQQLGSIVSGSVDTRTFWAAGNSFIVGTKHEGSGANGYVPVNAPLDIDVTADEWHHLIVSFAIPGPTGKLWIAFDDKNLGAEYLYPAAVAMMPGDLGGGGDPNAIRAGYDVYTDGTQVSGGFSPVDSPFGVPVAGVYTKYIRVVDMAELQIFAGNRLDTSIEANRRAFIDFRRDSEGNIIKNKDGHEIMEPVAPQKAATLMRKRPEVLLHGTSNWKSGRNTGSLDGDFMPTDPINKYSPDPSLIKK